MIKFVLKYAIIGTVIAFAVDAVRSFKSTGDVTHV